VRGWRLGGEKMAGRGEGKKDGREERGEVREGKITCANALVLNHSILRVSTPMNFVKAGHGLR